MWKRNIISGALERLWRQTQSMDCKNRVSSYKRGDRRLLVKNFESKYIKREVKSNFDNSQHNSIFKAISSQTINNYITALNSPNPYITKKLNNMDETKIFKKE